MHMPDDLSSRPSWIFVQNRYTYTYMYIHIYTYIYIYMNIHIQISLFVDKRAGMN